MCVLALLALAAAVRHELSVDAAGAPLRHETRPRSPDWFAADASRPEVEAVLAEAERRWLAAGAAEQPGKAILGLLEHPAQPALWAQRKTMLVPERRGLLDAGSEPEQVIDGELAWFLETRPFHLLAVGDDAKSCLAVLGGHNALGAVDVALSPNLLVLKARVAAPGRSPYLFRALLRRVDVVNATDGAARPAVVLERPYWMPHEPRAASRLHRELVHGVVQKLLRADLPLYIPGIWNWGSTDVEATAAVLLPELEFRYTPGEDGVMHSDALGVHEAERVGVWQERPPALYLVTAPAPGAWTAAGVVHASHAALRKLRDACRECATCRAATVAKDVA